MGLAIGLLAMPLTAAPGTVFRGLSYPALELLVLAGVLAGWVVADRLLAGRVAPWIIVAVIAGGAIAVLVAAYTFLFAGPGPGRGLALALAPAVIGGTLVRGPLRGIRGWTSLVAIAAVTSWLTYDVVRVPIDPLRDLHLYLNAGADALAGRSLYLDAPLATLPDNASLPFVYPPFVIPLFEALARLPRALAEVAWVAASLGAIVAGLWLLGVRGRWLVVLLAWPPFAIGVAVGNVAVFSFLLFVLGFRVGAALVLGGVFKLQSGIPALWLVRERRWRSLAVGIGILLALCLVTLPLTGWQAWFDWIQGLGHFQATTELFPSMKAASLTRWFPPAVLVAVTVIAVGLAYLGRRRNGLARFGLASVVASPTLYIHGLAPILPGALSLRPDLLWFVLGLGPWVGSGLSGWLAIGIVGLALLTAEDDDLSVPTGLSVADADLHPAGAVRSVWPDPER